MSEPDPKAMYIVSMALGVLDVWEAERAEEIDALADRKVEVSGRLVLPV
jgi:hypothetical protein